MLIGILEAKDYQRCSKIDDVREIPKNPRSQSFFFLSQLEVIPIKYMKKPIKQWRMEWKKMEKFLLLNVWIIAMLANYTHEGRSRRRQRRRQKKKKKPPFIALFNSIPC